MKVFNRTRNLYLAADAERADTFITRLLGLIPRKGLAPEEGLYLDPCAMIHTCFMRFPIDAVFVDREMRVLKVCRDLKPWKMSPWVRGARGVLELASGRSDGLAGPGDQLEFR